MALIGKIREKSWLLVAFIGIAMVAFILGDVDSLFNRGAQTDEFGIGTVNGEMVNEVEYNNFLNNQLNQIRQTKMEENNGMPVQLDANDEQNAMSQAWSGVVANHLLNKEWEKIGLVVDDLELENILYGQDGFQPSFFSMNFRDSITGEFSPTMMRQYMENLEESTDPQAAEQYNTIMRVVRQNRVEEKYNVLLESGIHTTTLEAKNEYLAQKEVKNVTYVFQNFTRVPQEVTENISEDEVLAFYEANKHKKTYEQKASRKINYISIPVFPNEDDTTRSRNFLEGLRADFSKATNDSAFVLRYSEVKEFGTDSSFIAFPEGTMSANQRQLGTFPSSIADEVENAEIGTIVGPYMNGPYLCLSKVVKQVNEPLATVRHILLTANDDASFTQAQRKADSIVRVIRANNNFEDMVVQFSEDPGSNSTGGKYEGFARGAMVPEFNDFSFDKPVGTLGTVKTTYGIHIVEVLRRDFKKLPIFATVARQVEVTKSSVDQIAANASSMIYDIDDLMKGKSLEEKTALFDTFAVNNGYNIRSLSLMEENPRVTGFGAMAEGRILRMAFEPGAKAGDLSSSPIKDNNQVVIAYLAEINTGGVPSFQGVEARMRAEVRKQKQAEYLMDQMVNKKDLQALATELGAQFQSEGLTFGASNVAVGREPIIIGTAFSGLRDGETSIPVKGSNGVFVLRVDSSVDAPETTDFSTELNQLNSQMVSAYMSRYRNALVNGADVVDNRKLRSYGIR
jgi:peptidyl-prolyl cis-trans isomerase D